MKKIIALALVLVCCTLPLFSCKEPSGIEKTQECYSNSLPTKIVTNTVQQVLDEKGKVIFTSVRNEQDSENLVWVDDTYVVFNPWLESNWCGCKKILEIIELELEIE